jgi:hypothetical protein
MLQVDHIIDSTIAVTTSAIIDLAPMDSGCCVTGSYVNGAPSAKTFDSIKKAAVVIEDITYTAATGGTAGNSITVAYTGGATAGAEVVTVLVNAISIQIETGVTTADQIKTAYDLVVAATTLAAATVSGTGGDAQVITAATPLTGGAASEIDLSANTLSIPSHGFSNGLLVRATTTATLPAGITTGTDYFVIKVSTSSIKLASSLANAVAGTAIDLTDDGTIGGVHTLTATASTGNVLKLQAGNDGTNFEDLSGVTVTIATTSGTKVWNLSEVFYRYVKVLYTPAAGQIALDVHVSYRLRG